MNECVVKVSHENPILAMGITAMLRTELGIVLTDALDAQVPSLVTVCGYDQALATLRSCHPSQSPRVLVVTGIGREFEVRSALRVGVRGYLLIDSCAHELAEAVRSVARGSRYVCRAVAPCIANSLVEDPLTGRESDVLQLVAAGLGNKQIATRLNIAVGTVKCHVKAILEKLAVATRTEAAAVANRRGLVASARSSEASQTDRWGLRHAVASSIDIPMR